MPTSSTCPRTSCAAPPAVRRTAATPHTTANGKSTCTATTTRRRTGASEPAPPGHRAARPRRAAFSLSVRHDDAGAAVGLHEAVERRRVAGVETHAAVACRAPELADRVRAVDGVAAAEEQ